MLITDCLAYTDIQVEISRQEDIFTITIKTSQTIDLSLTLHYFQGRAVAEGLLLLLNQTPLGDLTKASITYPPGDITLTLDTDTEKTTDEIKEEKSYACCCLSLP